MGKLGTVPTLSGCIGKKITLSDMFLNPTIYLSADDLVVLPHLLTKAYSEKAYCDTR